MRPLLIAAAVTTAALTLTGPDMPAKITAFVMGDVTGDIRVDADRGFRAPSTCEIRTFDKGDTAERPGTNRVRVCS